MKLNNIFKGIAAAASLTAMMSACTEQIQFGDSFIQMPEIGTATIDTVFTSAEYTQQFLTNIYTKQYYGLPYLSASTGSKSYWSGQLEAMSDCWHVPNSSVKLANQVYNGKMQASSESYVFCYEHENIWETVRACYLLMENVDRVPDMDEATKKQYKAEAKCLIASAYFNLMKFYGGLPLVTHAYEVNGDKLDVKRSSVEKTVNFIVNLFDEAANSGALPWAYTSDDDFKTLSRHWTKAAAMAMKCKVLQYAASPLFNDDAPYYRGTYEMENASQDSLLWYGGKKPELWQQCKKACEDFFNENAAQGDPYHLVEPTDNSQEAYRYAYRHAYLDQSSPEVIFATSVTNTNNDSKYTWWALRNNNRYSYNPTEEYQEMFPWADGKPFNWEETEQAGELDHMFIKGTVKADKQELQDIKYTRDPRLYETMCVNGQRSVIQYDNGKTSGQMYEMYVGGTNAGTNPETGNNQYGHGFFHNKYLADGPSGSVYQRRCPHWVVVRMSDLYLTYAEALLQADGNNTKALEYVDKVRARVGMKGLAECNPSENLTSNKDNLLNEILRERACELGFENTRFFDMQRYKRADLFERPLHYLRITRLIQKNGKWEVSKNAWWKNERTNKKYKQGDPEWYEPSHFSYERVPITLFSRIWWTEGFDPKWYMFPFPQSEVIKGYLVQNPGW